MTNIYIFKKNFSNSREALDELMELSYSLDNSDLCHFAECETYEQFKIALDEAIIKESWAYFSVYAEGDGFEFNFSTSSGINSVTLTVTSARCDAAYSVESHHSVRDSSIVPVMRHAGWKLQSVDSDTQRELEMKEDEVRVKSLLRNIEHGRLHMQFEVNFNHRTDIPSVESQFIAVDPMEDLKRVDLCPDLAAAVRRIAEKEQARSFVFPRLYEYNDEVRDNSSWYAEMFERYKEGLDTLITSCEYHEAMFATEEIVG